MAISKRSTNTTICNKQEISQQCEGYNDQHWKHETFRINKLELLTWGKIWHDIQKRMNTTISFIHVMWQTARNDINIPCLSWHDYYMKGDIDTYATISQGCSCNAWVMIMRFNNGRVLVDLWGVNEEGVELGSDGAFDFWFRCRARLGQWERSLPSFLVYSSFDFRATNFFRKIKF